MKRKYIMWVISICIIATIPSNTISFADTIDADKTERILTVKQETSDNNVEKISLSLDDAYKKLETSKTMELIKLKKKSDESVAKGYSETVSDFKELEESDRLIPGYDSSNKNIAKARRTFANSMIEPNNKARIMAMKQQAFQKYYTIKNTEIQVELAKDSLELKKTLLETKKRKYDVGVVSKRELENAEKDLKNAETNLEAMEKQLEQLRLSFNSYLGYDINQEVVLIDQMKECELPEIALTDAVTSALENRNEIKEADYNVQMSQLIFNTYKAYPTNSSKYISARTQLLNAEIANENKPTDIELDVRKKYDSMMDTYNTVQVGKKNLKSAEDSLNTTIRKYELGMVTFADVQQAQLALNNAKLNQANSLLNYNLAVESYNISMGVGITAVRL